MPDPASLAGVAVASGAEVRCAGNLPVELDDPGHLWFVEQGTVDVFLVERSAGRQQAVAQHVLRADRGRVLFGIAPQAADTVLSLVAKGRGAVLRRLRADDVTACGTDLAAQADRWIIDFSAMLSRDIPYMPRPDGRVEPGDTLAAPPGKLSVHRGVVWIAEPPPGDGMYLDLVDPAEDGQGRGGGVLPLTPQTWLTLRAPAAVSGRLSAMLVQDGLLLPALAHFHAVALSLERFNRSLAVVDQANLERASATYRQADEEGARRRLFDLYDSSPAAGATARDSTLAEALGIVGRHEGIDFKLPAWSAEHEKAVVLRDVLDASGVRGRRVRLAARDKWWTRDGSAMLAFRSNDGRPVALVPSLAGGYREIDPADRSSARVTAERAAALQPAAWCFYSPLPSGSTGLRDLLRFAGSGLTSRLARLVVTRLLDGPILLLPALVLGLIADEIVPASDAGLLYVSVGVLAAAAVTGALLRVLHGMASMRLEGASASRAEAAFWDRLTRLPSGFLNHYSAGDLALRGMTFQHLRDGALGALIDAVLSIVFLLPALLLMFLYDAALATVSAIFGALCLGATIALGLSQVSPRRKAIHALQRVASRLLQIVNGVGALRMHGAEGAAFAVWARDYREQKQAELDVGAREDHLQAFGAALPLLAAAVLFLAITLGERESMSAGDFLVAYTLFIAFLTAVTGLGGAFSAIAGIKPALDRVRSFLAQPPETSVGGDPVEDLRGEVRWDHVSFRYGDKGRAILDDVSIHAGPGEFVAIAGESGAGKSTLFRLALGLQQPSAGAVYYDGRDLKHLNLRQLRRRVGVVPQDVHLQPQDLWDNIVGDHDEATVEDAWEAARCAAVDGEIEAMPMGMATPVGAVTAVTSGGENQRILIAHALIHNPRVVMLDEATNWLDNETQAFVMDNLARLASTRIVIAHRLSTLREADRIYVLQAGKVVQEGPYEELTAVEGVFQDLVRRQTA